MLNLKHTLATVAVAAGLLAAAGPANAYQHNQTDLEFLLGSNHALRITDGTSNTIMFGARAATGTSERLASDGLGADFILMADAGGQF